MSAEQEKLNLIALIYSMDGGKQIDYDKIATHHPLIQIGSVFSDHWLGRLAYGSIGIEIFQQRTPT